MKSPTDPQIVVLISAQAEWDCVCAYYRNPKTEILPLGQTFQKDTECSRQTFSPVDCPTSSGQEETNDDGDDDRGNIEEQIPSVIPFP